MVTSIQEENTAQIKQLEKLLEQTRIDAHDKLEAKEQEMLDEKHHWMEFTQEKAKEYEAALAKEIGAEKVLQAEVARLKEKLAKEQKDRADQVKKLEGEKRDQLAKKDQEARDAQAAAEQKFKEAANIAAGKLKDLAEHSKKQMDAKDAAMAKAAQESQAKLLAADKALAAAKKEFLQVLRKVMDEWKGKMAAA